MSNSNSNKPTLKSTEIHNTPSIIDKNVSISRVHEPHWVNNITRLNETNVNLMRANLIKYIDLVVEALFKDVKTDINTLIKNSAGWVQFHTDTESKVTNAIGEIFNLVDSSVENGNENHNSNELSTEHKYQAAFGRFTIANGDAQFVCGRANKAVENALFIVGCGDDYILTEDATPQNGVTYYTRETEFGPYHRFEGTKFEEGTTYFEKDRSNALVINGNGTVNILEDVTFDSNGTFNGTVTFNYDVTFEELVTLKKGFNATGDSTVTGKLKVTAAPTAKQHVVRKKELDDLRKEISGALHYIGMTNIIPVPVPEDKHIDIYILDENAVEVTYKLQSVTAVAGDVVIVANVVDGIPVSSGEEYIFDGNSWTDYSENANYVVTKIYEEQQQKLHRALFSDSDGETPDWSDDNTSPDAKSLQTQLKTEIQKSNETLSLAISTLSDSIDEFHSNYFIFDGGGAQEADPDGDWN